MVEEHDVEGPDAPKKNRETDDAFQFGHVRDSVLQTADRNLYRMSPRGQPTA